MPHEYLRAGAAQAIVTPPVGAFMAGWMTRVTGDNIARQVHDELRVKALVLQRRDCAWALVANDLGGVGAVATERIRQGIAARTGLSPEAIAVCATHTHSGPPVSPIASTFSAGDLKARMVTADRPGADFTARTPDVSSTAVYAGKVDLEWRERFIATAIDTVARAWQEMRPAELAPGEAQVEGLASSRRVLLSDGSWDDPRRERSPDLTVVNRTELDPMVRTLWVREQDTHAPIAAVVNYGSHPWVFCSSALSADIAGATADKVAAAWAPVEEPPVVLYTSGPAGDVTLIWNIDIPRAWELRPEESEEESMARREAGFHHELIRLSDILARRVMAALPQETDWDPKPNIFHARRELPLPLKEGYECPPEIEFADWQKPAPPGAHVTEIQFLQAGITAILALPGEPFAALGKAIRGRCPYPHLIIAALSNDSGEVTYIAPREAHDLGGYEINFSPLAKGSGEILAGKAVDLLLRPD